MQYFIDNGILLLHMHLVNETSISINLGFVHFLKSSNNNNEVSFQNHEEEKYGYDSSWKKGSDHENKNQPWPIELLCTFLRNVNLSLLLPINLTEHDDI